MTKNTQTGSRLFFIEFLIVLFFFLIISTICLKLFARADLVTEEANALSQAQFCASSIAEAAEGSDAGVQAFKTLLPDAEVVPQGSSSDIMITQYFDRDFHICGQNQALYTLTARIFVDNRWKTGEVCVQKSDGTPFYRLPFSFYLPLTKEEVSA